VFCHHINQSQGFIMTITHHYQPILWALSLLAAAACATEQSDPSAADPSTADPALTHCVSTMSGEAACYATFTEAIAAATGGAITDAAADSHEAFADGTLTDRLNALEHRRGDAPTANLAPTPGFGDIVIGIVNVDAGFHGKDWTFVATSGCTVVGDASWAVQNLNTNPFTVSDINDNISSFRSFVGCGTVLYADWKQNRENPLAGQTALAQNASFVGPVMNDQASSIAWFRLP
jgi:hypothetical protein